MDVLLSRNQIRRVDQIAIEKYGMTGLVLMENAGAHAAQIIGQRFADSTNAIIFSGPGNNGGDGFVIARHLHNMGWNVRIVLAGSASRMTVDTRANHDIGSAMGLSITVADNAADLIDVTHSISSREVVIDALLGTGFQGSVREPTATLIHQINETTRRSQVAIDIPSGLDCDSGAPSNATIRADVTITFVARKTGFACDDAKNFLGEVHVAEIGSPRAIIDEVLADPF